MVRQRAEQLHQLVRILEAVVHPLQEHVGEGDRLAFVDTGPTSSEPLEIGDLTVDAAVATSVEVTGVHAVLADLTLENIAPATIAYVPEPGEILLLASGVAGLAGLYRLRRGSLSEE